MNTFIYSNTNKRYHTLDYEYKKIFGTKVFKVGLDAGFTCPNIDGTKGLNGCIYCSKKDNTKNSSPKDLVSEFYKELEPLEKKWPNSLYIGYFQTRSNTYAPVKVLKEKYETILKLDKVVGLDIATRPDCIDDECLEYLSSLNKKTYLTIELGLQTIHEKTAKLINRCHSLECFTTCVNNLRKNNINVVVHIINGLPYETKEDMLETVKFLNTLDIQGIKIHMLYIAKDTYLAKMYKEQNFPIMSKEEYIELVCDQLEYLRPEIVICRLTGDPIKEELIAPSWVLKKIDVLNGIDKCLAQRKSYQGINLK